MFYQRCLLSKSTLGNGLADQTAIRKVGAAHRLRKAGQGRHPKREIGTITIKLIDQMEAEGEVHYRATRFEQYGGWHNEQYFKHAVERLQRLESVCAALGIDVRHNFFGTASV